MLRPGGGFERRYWNAHIAPLAGPDGAVSHLVCTIEDVSDRAREARLGQVLSVDTIGILFFDAKGTLISANDAFLQWSGFSREDIAAGAISWRPTPPEYVAESEEQIRRLNATGRSGPYEKEYLTKDGRRAWMLFVGARLDDGTLIEYAIDISARKAAERDKREMAERYRTLFDRSMPASA